MTYNVSVDLDGKVYARNVRRRYRDFVWLRTSLAKLFPAVVIPPLPEKRMLFKNNRFNELRILGLRRFLYNVLSQDFLSKSGPLKAFLSPDNFEDEKKQEEAKIRSRKISDILTEYSSHFKSALEFDLPKEPLEKMLMLKDFLVDSKRQLQALVTSCSAISDNFYHINLQLMKMTKAFEELQKGEDGLIGKVPSEKKLSMLKGFHTLTQAHNDNRGHWSDFLVDAVQSEVYNIQAMEETVQTWMSYNNQLTKASAKMKKYSNERNVKDVAKMEAEMQEEKQLREFVAALTKIMLQHNLRLIWKSQSVKFTTDVNGFIESQKGNATEQMRQIYAVCKAIEDFDAQWVVPRELGIDGPSESKATS
uniref:PX domain-containing protein n=1 Tax=Lotharella oceanica TaxID=641309 RepID=A0A7S2TMU1_9EUKA